MSKRSAIVIGATGLVGREVVNKLCADDRYISVTTIGRNKLNITHEKLIQKICSLDEISELDFDFANEIYCCLGTTIKKAKTREQFEKVDYDYPLHIAAIAKKKGIEHYIVISAMGANERAKAYYSRVKGKLENALIELDLKRLSIIQPSLLVGEREEFRLGEKFGEVMLNICKPLLIGPLKKIRPILATQVAEAMVAIALKESKQAVTIYKSDQLAKLSIPPILIEEKGIDREATFNWQKLEEDQTTVVDEEVVFKRDNNLISEDEEQFNNRS